jgi:hypothetical protein
VRVSAQDKVPRPGPGPGSAAGGAAGDAELRDETPRDETRLFHYTLSHCLVAHREARAIEIPATAEAFEAVSGGFARRNAHVQGFAGLGVKYKAVFLGFGIDCRVMCVD